MLVRAIVRRQYLTVGYLVRLLRERAGTCTEYRKDTIWPEPVTFVGIERPEGLPDGSEVITLDRLSELVPE